MVDLTKFPSENQSHLYVYGTPGRSDGMRYAIGSSPLDGPINGSLAEFNELDDAHVAAVAMVGIRGEGWVVHVLPSAATPLAEMVEHVKMYAVDHYNDGGWDVIVEAWDDSAIEDVIVRDKAVTKATALACFVDVVDVWADRQADARNSAF